MTCRLVIAAAIICAARAGASQGVSGGRSAAAVGGKSLPEAGSLDPNRVSAKVRHGQHGQNDQQRSEAAHGPPLAQAYHSTHLQSSAKMRKRRTRRHPTSKIAVTAADTTAASKERHIPAGASKEPAIRLNVLRALDFYHSRVGAGHLGRLSVSALAGAELVGDPTALQDASLYGSDLQITDINDIEDGVGAGDQMVGRITVNGEKVPVFSFQGDGDDANVTIAGIGDVAIGNLSTSRKYVRLLTCAQVASVRNQVSDEDNEIEICRFVRKHCQPHGALLNYLELPYCHLRSQPWLGGLFLLAWVVLLLIWLAAQVPYLVPSLNTMSDVCSLSQTVAGVTFLAFGNGCADLFSMLAATLSGPGGMELAVGEVLGNGMFVFCAVQGTVALVCPFYVRSGEFVRDCAFYCASIVATAAILLDGKIVVWEGVLMLMLYVIYVVIVILADPFDQLVRLVQGGDGLGSSAETGGGAGEGSVSVTCGHGPKSTGTGASGSDMTEYEAQRQLEALRQYQRLKDESDSPLGVIAEFMMESGSSMASADLPWYDKAYRLLAWPMVLLLKLTVPVVDQDLPNEGWIRPVVTLQMFCFPFLLAGFIGVQASGHVAGSPFSHSSMLAVFALTTVVSATLSVLTWRLSDNDKAPSFWRYMAFIGFTTAIIVIYTTAKEIVNVILAFGVVFEVGSLILGVTILAVGIGMQDLVTCIGIARAGYPAMAASACVGCAMMNIFLGLGLSGVLGPLLVQDPYSLYISVQLLCCLIFMVLSVLIAIFVLWLFNWQANRIFGVTLIGIYVLFIVVSITIDLFGADASNSLVEQASQG